MNIIKVKKNNLTFNVEDSEELKQDSNYKFWENEYSSWEKSTFDILDEYLDINRDFLDIGSWIGPTSIYASFLSRKVIAVEPDPVAYSILNKNIELNNIKNIETINKAATKVNETYIKSVGFYGNSMTRINENGTDGVLVNGIGIDSLISMGNFSLIKIDIEGHEFDLIPDYIDFLVESKIPTFVSLHYPFVDNKEVKFESLINCFSLSKKIFDENGNQISSDSVTPGFGSYLLIW